MAKVFGPALSLAATGTLADTINFVCGKYARRALGVKFNWTYGRQENASRWVIGCGWWSSLEEWEKLEWKNFVSWITWDGCKGMIGTWWTNGFQCFMMFWMNFGYNGWDKFPLPPFPSPKYPKGWYQKHFLPREE